MGDTLLGDGYVFGGVGGPYCCGQFGICTVQKVLLGGGSGF